MFAAAVALAFASQAASVDWSVTQKTWLMSDGETKPLAVTVYLFDTSASGYSAFVSDLTGGKLGDSISATTLTSAAGYVDSAASWNASTKTAQINANYGKVSQTTSTIGGSVGERGFSVIILDGQNYLVSGSASGAVYTDPDDASSATFTSVEMAANGWKLYTPSSSGGDVPEPTSGILLLVGGAILALRRRR